MLVLVQNVLDASVGGQNGSSHIASRNEVHHIENLIWLAKFVEFLVSLLMDLNDHALLLSICYFGILESVPVVTLQLLNVWAICGESQKFLAEDQVALFEDGHVLIIQDQGFVQFLFRESWLRTVCGVPKVSKPLRRMNHFLLLFLVSRSNHGIIPIFKVLFIRVYLLQDGHNIFFEPMRIHKEFAKCAQIF